MKWTQVAEQMSLPHTTGQYHLMCDFKDENLMSDSKDEFFSLEELEMAKAMFHEWAQRYENVLLQWEVIGDDGAVDSTEVILNKGEFPQ